MIGKYDPIGHYVHKPVNIVHSVHNGLGHGIHSRPVAVGKYKPLGHEVGGKGLVHTSSNMLHSKHNGSSHGTHEESDSVGK